jgi:large subunit ribosomal protein L31
MTRRAKCGARRGAGGGANDEELDMKADIHPKYEAVTATCSCGNQIVTRSTMCEDISLDVCSECHPFFTGKQKVMDTGGRVDRFKKRFGNRTTKR